MEGGGGQRIAGADAEQGAQHAQAAAFEQHLAQQLAALEAQHPQQRELAAPAHHRQRLRRKHEEGAGEQRHQRQDRQVDPVGAAHIRGAAFLLGVVRLPDREAARPGLVELRCEIALEGGAIDAVAQLEVDPRQLAQPVETPLGGADVHHRQALAGARPLHRTGHAQAHFAGASTQHHGVAAPLAEPGLGRRRQEQRVVGQDVEPAAFLRHPEQVGRNGAGAEWVDADDAQRSFGSRHAGLDVENRRGQRHLGMFGQEGIDGFVEQRLAALHLDVGLARQALDRSREFVEGGGVDQVDGETHCHPDRDRGDGNQGAHRMRAPLAEQQPA